MIKLFKVKTIDETVFFYDSVGAYSPAPLGTEFTAVTNDDITLHLLEELNTSLYFSLWSKSCFEVISEISDKPVEVTKEVIKEIIVEKEVFKTIPFVSLNDLVGQEIDEITFK
jgi:hypothetical protein